ncbi:terminase large subunit domain-containing protein [Sinirhodobacter huangdaonensis]|nr:terminase large subunit [Sinirhodobacter huangdaonensis]
MTEAAPIKRPRGRPRKTGPNAQTSEGPGTGGLTVPCARSDGLAEKTLAFIRSLRVPEGPLHGQNFALAPFQERFIRGVLDADTMVAMLSVGRGQGKSMLSAALALAHVMGVSDDQPRRQVVIAARVKEQARISWEYVQAIVGLLPEEEQALFTFRQAPRLEISYEGAGGGMIRAVAADAKNLLGLSPTLIIEDEFGHWHPEKGMQLHAALETSAGKRRAKMVIISTSASDDTHPFSQMLDTPPPHSFVIECRAPLGMPADDLDGIKAANPGSEFGIGPSLDWLQQQARIAIQRGGQALTGFRLYSLNQRVSDVGKAQLLTVDEWTACEVSPEDLPPREGDCVIGLDLGGSRSMSAFAAYWPSSGRLEVQGAFPTKPGLAERGEADGVKDRYIQMAERGELITSGESTVQVGPWLRRVWDELVQDANVVALVADRYRQAELLDAMAAAGIRAPVVFRGQGFRDGGLDTEAFRKAVFDGEVLTVPSLLLRSAASDALVVMDDAMNAKLTKARSLGRIDAIAASILAVAEGQRRKAAPVRKARVAWL